MPQRSVATNFTFEQQRQEINLLAADFWTQKGIVDTAAPTYLKHDGSNNFTGQTLAVPNAFTINANSGSGTVTISGNLDVTGTTTTVSSANLEVTDKNILIAKGSTSDAQADGAGLTIDSATDITFQFLDANDSLVSSIGLEASTFLKAPYGQFTGSGTATVGQGVEINAPDANTGQIISYDRANTAYKELRVKGSSVGIYGGTSNALSGTFNSTGLIIELGKKIGIGTASPTNALDVQGGATNTAIVARSTDAKSAISFVDNTTTGVGSVAVGAEGDDLFLTSGSGGAERIRIEGDGKIKLITASTTDYLQYGNNPRLWLKCPSGINGLRIDADTTPLEIKKSNNDGKSIAVDSNFNFSVNGDYSLSAGEYDSSGKIFLNATRHNGTGTSTSFQTSIQAVATSNTNNTGYLGFGASATPDDLIIATSGNVGISRIPTEHPLEVEAASSPTVSLWRDTTKGFAITAETVATYFMSYQNAPLSFSVGSGTSYTERFTISDKAFSFAAGVLEEPYHNDTGGGIQSNYNHDILSYGEIFYGVTNAVANFTFNVRGNATNTFNDITTIGKSTTVTSYITANSKYMTEFRIDGTAQTVKWVGGSAPSSGSASGVDVYSFTIMKTAANTYHVFGNVTNFA